MASIARAACFVFDRSRDRQRLAKEGPDELGWKRVQPIEYQLIGPALAGDKFLGGNHARNILAKLVG